MLTIATVVVLNGIFASVLGGIGRTDYPIAYTNDGVQVQMMSSATFIVMATGWLMGCLMFIMAINVLLQQLIHNVFVSLIGIVVVCLLGMATTNSAVLPFSYLNVARFVAPTSGTDGVFGGGCWAVDSVWVVNCNYSGCGNITETETQILTSRNEVGQCGLNNNALSGAEH